jgi:hypothetical protein
VPHDIVIAGALELLRSKDLRDMSVPTVRCPDRVLLHLAGVCVRIPEVALPGGRCIEQMVRRSERRHSCYSARRR